MSEDHRVIQVVILAAGMGTRLAKPWPKPLTPLLDGRTIMQQQIDNILSVFGSAARIHIVVGFKMDMIMEAHPRALFIYNEEFDQTNTAKSLLRALNASQHSGVLWMNGDIVFDPLILERVSSRIHAEQSFCVVNTARTAEEEIKYTIDTNGYIKELSKTTQNALGEAIGINYIAQADKQNFIDQLVACSDQDYFERGLELAIENNGLKLEPVNISDLFAMEIDFPDDLSAANKHYS
jgi:choline kinase